MANYKKRRTVKNSRAHRHAGSWTCRGRLRYERHAKLIEKVEKDLMELNRCFEAAHVLADTLKAAGDNLVRDVELEENMCGCCCTVSFSLLVAGEWRQFFIRDDSIETVTPRSSSGRTEDFES